MNRARGKYGGPRRWPRSRWERMEVWTRVLQESGESGQEHGTINRVWGLGNAQLVAGTRWVFGEFTKEA